MTADTRSAIEKCETRARSSLRLQRQPLQQRDTQKIASSTVSADICYMGGKDFLVTVDGLSGYSEVDRT